ncbi:MAG: hypothetical protein FJ398_16075 [Verrucomicrobia bacterium]|nr:hypothetical protein [Verrucomicrobiota bacterium]
MKALVRNFATNPLMPGCVLASIMGDPQSRLAQSWDYATLAHFNKQGTLDIVSHFQSAGLINDEQAAKIIGSDTQFVTAFKQLVPKIPDVGYVTGCDAASVERLARALFSAKLLAEKLEILTPPQLSYEKTPKGTVDLLESLYDAFRKIVGGAWSVFFPLQDFSLATDASAQFWMACLYTGRTDEMVNGFVGLFRREHRVRLLALNRGHVKEKGIHLRDVITEYLDNSKDKITKLHEVGGDYVRQGLDHAFNDIVQVVGKLKLPPLVVLYYEFLTQEMERFINSNPGFHSRFTRFIEFPDYTPQELCRIFCLMCWKNGLALTPGLKEKILHHFTLLHRERADNFGNARLVRNCFESVINAQAMRLANAGSFELRALTLVNEADPDSPAQSFLADYRQKKKGHLVKCPHCDHLYSWTPEMEIVEAICQRCGKNYNCEFGIVQE